LREQTIQTPAIWQPPGFASGKLSAHGGPDEQGSSLRQR